MSKNLRGGVLLLLTAIIWGFAFVAQSEGSDKMGALTFQAARTLLAVIVLLPVSLFSFNIRKKLYPNERFFDKKTTIAGVVCGTIFCLASALQQVGIANTSVGHSGFLTALYLLIVPIIGLFFGRKVSPKLWACIVLALVGLCFLCHTDEGIYLNKGDIFVICSSFVFSAHILAIDKLSAGVDGVRVSFFQMLTACILSFIFAFIFEEPVLADIVDSWLPVLYAGILSCGVAYTLQIIGQKYTHPTVASIIMSLESVFAVIGGMIFLTQIPSLHEAIGCLLMFSATIISQLPDKKQKAKAD